MDSFFLQKGAMSIIGKTVSVILGGIRIE